MRHGSETADVSFIRNNYYVGKLLRAVDFIREQEYVNKKLEFINRSFHGCGIIEGLDVRMEKDGTLHISEGSALDPCGRILIVPEETTINVSKLEGLPETSGHDFILGIRYAERTAEEEISYLEPEKPNRGARIEESFALRAYTREDWKNLKASEDESTKMLTEETLLFENENVRFVLLTPKAVPSDSVFRCRIQARVLHGNSAGIKWRCMASLQGAFFAESGQTDQMLEGEDTVFSGSVTREWEICTEENRRHPITLELTQLEIISGNSGRSEPEACRICIETELSYEDIVKKYLWQEERMPGQRAEWLPLAYIETSDAKSGEQAAFEVSKEQDVRSRAFCPAWEQICRQEAERNGIVDIRWRGLLKVLWQTKLPSWPPEPLPQPYGPPPRPLEPFPSQPQQGRFMEQIKDQVREQLQKQIQSEVQELVREQAEETREKCIRRGIAVIPIPRHYRKGRTLFSEEIAHGFPGEEVFIWCGRVFEEKNYAYWSRDKMRYSVLGGDEELFSDPGDSGWKINKQAIRQNVEDGTFQVALTLSKGRWRNRSREVAISWIAVKTI